jgi:hypothetical protein
MVWTGFCSYCSRGNLHGSTGIRCVYTIVRTNSKSYVVWVWALALGPLLEPLIFYIIVSCIILLRTIWGFQCVQMLTVPVTFGSGLRTDILHDRPFGIYNT